MTNLPSYSYLIEIKDLSKKFGNHTFALNKLSMSIKEGSIVGIIGMSGAGKSTLLRCLTGLEKPCSGSILFEGKELVSSFSEDKLKLRQQLGLVFQHFHLFSSRTAAENIAYPLEIRGISKELIKKKVTELLSLVGLAEKGNHYPNQLSGGEKQRVGIARALAHDPKLLLCDEPTSALDPKTTRSILQLLQKLNKQLGLTIVLITHQMEAVKQICEEVAVLSQGSVVERGSVITIFTKPQHEVTRHLLQLGRDHIPQEMLQAHDEKKQLIRLSFEGEQAKQPVLSHLIRRFDVDANILWGQLDRVQNQIIGSLVVELEGEPSNIQDALEYVQKLKISYEVLV